MRIPVATYRLQFNREFRFTDALKIVDYLHRLGITDVYASPILKAKAGSGHGYDVTDPSQINPEIGTPEEFDQLCRAIHDRGMALLVDIVPNHMAASLENPWWFDVLERGEESPYASFFDVNWASRKVMLPILATTYGEALENHELQIRLENGRPVLLYREQKLPLAAGAENLSFESVDPVLSRQHYRLAYWRKAADAINYRRFFDINDLVGLRAERDDVFQETHRLILQFIEEGKVDGLRIDHVDGLREPKEYLDRLPDVYVTVEKILAGNEQLPCDWRTQGTTGYDFTNYASAVFIDREGYRKLERIYAGATGSRATYAQVFHERKRQVMRELFAGEMHALVVRLSELAEADRHARDLQTDELHEALAAVTANLQVYRTYIRNEQISDTDRAHIEVAIEGAGKGPQFNFLRRVLLLEPAWYLQEHKSDYLDFVTRWQQFTGPVMAKGLEDTTFYAHAPLVSVNEVGGDSNGPETYFGVEAFHRRNLLRHRQWPHTMNATSTHDTKRSEDVRARINVLSEFPDQWRRSLRRWMRMNPSKRGPDAAEQIFIYQSMLGAWPIKVERLKQYVTKALREAKTHTTWIHINEAYEASVMVFIDSLYGNEKFLSDFTQLQSSLAYFGSLSSLSQLVLKITSPGVPDFYRGTELWELTVADPDNRRPVDFSLRARMLEELPDESGVSTLLNDWTDGRLKMYVTCRLLDFRRQHSELFSQGEYIPLRVKGARANHIIAFARRVHGTWSVTAVPRLCASLTRTGLPPLGAKVWRDTEIELPADAPRSWTNVLTHETMESRVTAAALFDKLPVAVLSSADAPSSCC
jgi:(1->4)-alpha-D-glucan 1-alpha-D-glucosylmutase